MHAKSLQSCQTLRDQEFQSSPGSSGYSARLLQVRIPEWVTMPSSRDLPDQGIKSTSLRSSALADGFFTSSTTWETLKVKVKVSQSCPTLCNHTVCIVHGVLPDGILEWVAFLFSRGSSNPGIKPRFPALQADYLPAEPQWKAKNTGVGSLSLLQGISLTQELNWGFLHCRQIFYQQS